MSNQELKIALDELGSTFHLEREGNDTGLTWEPLPNFEQYYTKFVDNLAEFAILFYPEFKKGE